MEHYIWSTLCFLLFWLLLAGDAGAAQQNESSRRVGRWRKEVRYGRPVLAMANSPSCMFDGKPIEDGKTVTSPEPCLNCTCSRGILLCYLHTCNSIVPSPGCRVVKKPGTCCPQLECNDDDPTSADSNNRAEGTSKPINRYRLRQDEDNFFGLLGVDPRTERAATTTITSRRLHPKLGIKGKGSLFRGIPSHRRSDTDGQLHYEQEEDHLDDELLPDRHNSTGYCISRGLKYTEGMAMLSPTKCEYCYCIGGQQMCVRPKCHLNIDGCVPRYQSGYTCCPSHYNCEIATATPDVNGNQSDVTATVTTTSCNIGGYDFPVGVAVPNNGNCQTCYCTKMGVVCRRLECSPNIPGCTPVVPEGHCCPTQYKCDQKISSTSHVPVSHSTDNYDVTIISSSKFGDSTEPQKSETEIPRTSIKNEKDILSTGIEESETTTGTSLEKQKITVELSEESDLESISVIPEENIAVLVLTTDKENEENSPTGSTSSEAETDTSKQEDSTSQFSAAPTGPRRKVKPTQTHDISSRNRNSTEINKGGTKINSHKQKTTTPDSYENEENSYSYDYVELYDEVPYNTRETFDPYSDYNIHSDSSGSTEGNHEKTQITKVKEKSKPYLITETGLTTRAKYPDYKTTRTTSDTDGSTDASYTLDDNLDKYTVFSTGRTREDATTGSFESITTRRNPPQRRKHRPSPGIITRHQTTLFRTPITSHEGIETDPGTSEDIRNAQTIPFDDIENRNTYTTDTSGTKTHRPSFSTRPNKKKISNRRRKPEVIGETTLPRHSTQPQDIAEFLWTLTQSQHTQTPSAENEDQPATKQGTAEQSYFSETLPPIALAAPKLIFSDSSTVGSAQPNLTSIHATPSFNFNPPEVIFSAHGPTYNRKGYPPPVREPEIPLIINNHKKTSTRLRPPVKFRPSVTTPSEENSFVEISNHRPTNSFRRPSTKFPPYPHFVNRPDSDYHRDPYLRDSHPKLHRFDSDAHPEWSEDYEEYFYDSEHEAQITTKIYNNIQNNNSTLSTIGPAKLNSNLSNSENSDNLTITKYLTPHTSISMSYSVAFEESTAQNENITIPPNLPLDSVKETMEPEKGNNFDDAESRSSEIKIVEDSNVTKKPFTTVPYPKSTYYMPTLTTATTLNDYDTTKSFSGYVRNKHKGTSNFVLNSEGKFSRAEDNNRLWDKGPTDHRQGEQSKVSTDTSTNYLKDFPSKHSTLSSTSSRAELSTPSSGIESLTTLLQVEDDSKEIGDVCFVDGRYYTSGETITKSNPCEMCRCFYGQPLCQVQQCPTPPDPTCALEYVPGYCCPVVTCGLETNPDQPPGITSMSAPEPTSQEIRPPLIESDNQWKPLPHGPFGKTTQLPFQEVTVTENPTIQNVTVPKPVPEKVMVFINDPFFPTEKSTNEVPETTTSFLRTISVTTTPSETTEQTATTTFSILTDPAKEEEDATTEEVTMTSRPLSTTESSPTEANVTDVPSTTTATTTELPEHRSKPNTTSGESKGSQQDKSEIHDNSSGVRKFLGGVVTLPPSKVALSEAADGVDTILPVIVTMPTISTPRVVDSGMDLVTMSGLELAGQSTELGGNLKVSGCNVYGKYYRINDKVTVLSKSCTACVCTSDGIACTASC